MEDRLDRAIEEVGYILDCLKAYRNIVNSGCCNQCDNLENCPHRPEWGAQTRYNCPFFKKWSVRT